MSFSRVIPLVAFVLLGFMPQQAKDAYANDDLVVLELSRSTDWAVSENNETFCHLEAQYKDGAQDVDVYFEWNRLFGSVSIGLHSKALTVNPSKTYTTALYIGEDVYDDLNITPITSNHISAVINEPEIFFSALDQIGLLSVGLDRYLFILEMLEAGVGRQIIERCNDANMTEVANTSTISDEAMNTAPTTTATTETAPTVATTVTPASDNNVTSVANDPHSVTQMSANTTPQNQARTIDDVVNNLSEDSPAPISTVTMNDVASNTAETVYVPTSRMVNNLPIPQRKPGPDMMALNVVDVPEMGAIPEMAPISLNEEASSEMGDASTLDASSMDFVWFDELLSEDSNVATAAPVAPVASATPSKNMDSGLGINRLSDPVVVSRQSFDDASVNEIDLDKIASSQIPEELSGIRQYMTDNENYNEAKELINSLYTQISLLEKEKEALRAQKAERPEPVNVLRSCRSEAEQIDELQNKANAVKEENFTLKQSLEIISDQVQACEPLVIDGELPDSMMDTLPPALTDEQIDQIEQELNESLSEEQEENASTPPASEETEQQTSANDAPQNTPEDASENNNSDRVDSSTSPTADFEPSQNLDGDTELEIPDDFFIEDETQ